ncbi:hypothetical protein [Nocardia huaxiensis]|uniref:hypothetical protein n=1 Tax=Nocardia huaxiensis TaxID=2755382 RepID=UPI001E5EB3CF|nr:hypothetical protein [Nocardia huaxiensis]UFS99827.1 hypothetical protein LPY97_19090 [Nocardia huaxiensis]
MPARLRGAASATGLPGLVAYVTILLPGTTALVPWPRSTVRQVSHSATAGGRH